ncbi:MAG: membrane protein insertase YidC [Sphaerospermopsis sp. SIO1G2]|nr:membrane protein insertase YidC [Sphaerospermopsis sp. SIO1G2]
MQHNNIPPSHDDNRNVLIALALTALVLFGWKFFVSDPEQARIEAARQMHEEIARTTAPTDALIPDAADAGISSTIAPTRIPSTRHGALTTEPRVRINTPSLHGSLRLQGLRFDDLTLANYHDTPDPQSPEVVLLTPRLSGEGYFAEFGWVGSGTQTPDAMTQWHASHEILTQHQPVTFHWVSPQFVRFEQEVRIDEHYMFHITRRVINQSGQPLQLAPYSLINRTLNQEAEQFFILHQGPLGVSDGQLNEYSYGDLKDGKIMDEQSRGWAGITDKYWLTALVPDQTSGAFKTSYQHYKTGQDQRYQIDVLDQAMTISAGETAEHSIHLFAGAKLVDLLDAYSDTYQIPLFDRAIDFGSLYFLTRPFFSILQWLHSYLGNFGLAILALTVLIKTPMYPLANKSYASMSQMKLLMPKMTEIRERFTDDRMRMNQEIMEMYKREGVNPASGCLPILIQIPVFFALYKVLFITIEMRHEPFYGWISDLSAMDPTNIFTLFGLFPWGAPSWLHVGAWPLIMMVTMIIQQRLNPKPADPTQAQVMQLLPYMFLFLFASFPAGLVIYWAWNNSLSVIQQYIITKRYEKLYDKETGKRIGSLPRKKKR